MNRFPFSFSVIWYRFLISTKDNRKKYSVWINGIFLDVFTCDNVIVSIAFTYRTQKILIPYNSETKANLLNTRINVYNFICLTWTLSQIHLYSSLLSHAYRKYLDQCDDFILFAMNLELYQAKFRNKVQMHNRSEKYGILYLLYTKISNSDACNPHWIKWLCSRKKIESILFSNIIFQQNWLNKFSICCVFSVIVSHRQIKT